MAKAAAKPKPSRTIIAVSVDSLTLDPNNARKHGQSDVEAIAKSLESFKQQTPIVITSDNVVVKGNGTVMAAMKLGWKQVDAIRTELTGQQVKAYAIADNRTAELSEWDNEKLLELLQGLDDKALFDACGFDEVAMDELLAEVESPVDPEDNPYSRKIEAPIYRPTGEKPAVADLIDTGKVQELVAEVLAAKLPAEVEDFLVAAANRHAVFNFERIAEFYCHADAKTQSLMEKSACVIIDFDKAVEGGYVMLGEKLSELYGKEYLADD